MPDIATLPTEPLIAPTTKVITTAAKVITYQMILDQLRTDIISDNLGTPSTLEALSQVGVLSLLSTFNSGMGATGTFAGLSKLIKQITVINNGIDGNNDLDFGEGNFIFSDYSGQASIGALTKRLDAAWTVGTNQGGLFSGVKTANTTYHIFTIYDPINDIADIGFSTSTIAADRPPAYTKFDYLASVLTDIGTNIRPGTYTFLRGGSYDFYHQTPISDHNVTNPGIAGNLRPLTVATGISVNPLCSIKVYDDGDNFSFIVTSPLLANVIPSVTISDVTTFNADSAGGNVIDKKILTNTLGQIRTRFSASDASTTERIMTSGWTFNKL